ncbi:hypothetical protein ACOMHN_003138 [Nucella lapillus]
MSLLSFYLSLLSFYLSLLSFYLSLLSFYLSLLSFYPSLLSFYPSLLSFYLSLLSFYLSLLSFYLSLLSFYMSLLSFYLSLLSFYLSLLSFYLSLLSFYPSLLSFYLSLLSFYLSLLSFYPSLLSFYLSLLSFYLSLLSFYLSLLSFYLSLLSFYLSLLSFYLSLLSFYPSLLSFYLSLLSFYPSLLSFYLSLLSFYLSLLSFYLSLLSFYLSLLSFYLSLLSFYLSLLSFYPSLLSFYLSLLSFYLSLLSFYPSLLSFYLSLLSFYLSSVFLPVFWPGQVTLPRQAEQSMMEAYGHRTLSGRSSPGSSRRGVSMGTQTPAGVQPTPRLVRKSSMESPYLYRQFTLEDGLEAAKEQQQRALSSSVPLGAGAGVVGAAAGPSQRQGLISGGLPLSTSHGTVPTATTAADRSKQLQAADSGSRSSAVRLRDLHFSRKPLHIPYSEFEPYKADIHKRVETSRAVGLDGMLNIHIMSGQGLKSSKTSLRDLYCVVAVDSLNKARTMIRTGAINFDWDEAFDVDLEDSKEVSFLIYHWDPSYKHRLCFHGSVLLPGYVTSGQRRYVAIKMEPKGILFVTLLYKEPALSLQRLPSVRKNALFGVDLETVIKRENSGLNVPLLVKKCVEEVEGRGVDTVGIYRLCGSARRKIMLREAFEKNAAAVDLSPENVSDIHVVTGVLKDYLRELPEPLFTNALYQMLLDALSVRLPSDPEGSAKLMLSILECLPTGNQDTMALILNHLRRVSSHTEKNKMTADNLAICFGPVLLCPAPSTTPTPPDPALHFRKHIEVLRYLLEIWEYDSSASTSKSATAETVVSLDGGSGGMSAAEAPPGGPRSSQDRGKPPSSSSSSSAPHSSHC